MEERRRRERRFFAAAGGAAVAVFAVNLFLSVRRARRQQKKRNLLGSSVRVNLSESDISRLVDHLIVKSKETYDLVASVPLDKVTYANVLAPLAELEAEQFPMVQSCIFPRMVSSSSDIRQASYVAEKKLDRHLSMCRERDDVYRVIKAYVDKGEDIEPEARRFAECLVRDFEHNGAKLTQSKRDQMEKLKAQINDLSLKYIQNLNDDRKFLLLDKEMLAGMPPEFFMDLEKVDGKLKVPMRKYLVTAILEHCKIGSTRRLVGVSYGERGGKENLNILKDLCQLRNKLARLLGYSNYADFVIERRMAKASAKVFELLEEISEKLDEIATRELHVLEDLKRKEEGDSPLGMEDFLYYMKRAEEQLDLNLGEIKQYFPLNLVFSGILKVFQDLFGLIFDEINEAEVWHDTVRLFSVRDMSSFDLLGYFYVDLFARDGKFPHTCVVPLQNRSVGSTGAVKVPVALLVSQCPVDKDGNEALIRFPEVVSLFHEFSHLVHHICNHASFSRFSGLQIEADFTEIPSQLFEKWCYVENCLKMISGFHQDITRSITNECCEKLKRRHDMFAGLKLKQEILICLVDQIIHSHEDVDIATLLRQLHPKIMLDIPLLEGTMPASSFPQIAVGYDAVCYSHIWSEVIAADIFASKFEGDILNHCEGLEFRNKVLAPGGATDPLEIISNYLGREPLVEPFIESKLRSCLY